MINKKNQLSLVFRNTNFRDQMDKYAIPQQHVLKCANQTNPQYCDRWRNGADMNSSTISKLCSHLHLNLLSFFSYYGHTFETELENLYRLEKAGMSVADILSEHGIRPYNPNSLHHTYGEIGIDRESEDAQIKLSMERYRQTSEIAALSVREVIDKIDKIRTEHKAETDELYKQIGKMEALLEAEKEKNRQLRSEIEHHSTLHVTDDSNKDDNS